jgi:hypothetical protein
MTLNYWDEVFKWDGMTVPMPAACQAVQEVEEQNERDTMIAVVSFALRASYHKTMKAAPTPLAFGQDMFFPTTYIANWHQQRVQAIDWMTLETACENCNRVMHTYEFGDRVLICCDCGGEVLAKLAQPTYGPNRIVCTFPNGTVCINRRCYTEKINICCLLPNNQAP